MSLLWDEWPADEPPPPPRLTRRVWPWLVGVLAAIALWSVPWGLNPFSNAYSLAVVAFPTALALLGVALLARTRLPGWAIALAHFLVLPTALLIPLGIALVVEGSSSWDPLFEIAYAYFIGCIWALTALLITGTLTAIRLLARTARTRPEPSAAPLRRW